MSDSFVSPWTITHQIPLSMGFPRQEYSWSGLPFTSPRGFPDLGIEPLSPALRQWHPTPLLLSGKSHGRRSLVGCSPWGHYESDMTERLHFPFSLSCIGEGNGNPLQYSCLENPRDGGAWAAPSRTRLMRLSSSSSCIGGIFFTIWAPGEAFSLHFFYTTAVSSCLSWD